MLLGLDSAVPVDPGEDQLSEDGMKILGLQRVRTSTGTKVPPCRSKSSWSSHRGLCCHRCSRVQSSQNRVLTRYHRGSAAARRVGRSAVGPAELHLQPIRRRSGAGCRELQPSPHPPTSTQETTPPPPPQTCWGDPPAAGSEGTVNNQRDPGNWTETRTALRVTLNLDLLVLWRWCF